MKIVVFGANGGVGRSLVEQALAQGHEVTAAVRNPASFPLAHDRLRVVTSDVFDPASVSRAVAGQDAVFCTVGVKTRARVTLYSEAARNILQGMEEHHVRRLVFLSNFGVLDEKADDLRGKLLLWMIKRVLPHTLADHRLALEEMKRHAIDWVAVRPLGLSNRPRSGQYRVVLDGIPPKGISISRADVADFMLQQMTSNKYLRKTPAIAD